MNYFSTGGQTPFTVVCQLSRHVFRSPWERRKLENTACATCIDNGVSSPDSCEQPNVFKIGSALNEDDPSIVNTPEKTLWALKSLSYKN